MWLMALGGPVGRCVSVMLNKNIYTEVGKCAVVQPKMSAKLGA